jgi:hypothetical protein
MTMILTKAQRLALKRVYDRNRSNHLVIDCAHNRAKSPSLIGHVVGNETAYNLTCRRLSYREFRRRAFQGSDCIMLAWCGMWLGIEPDGYTHS